MNGFYMVKHEYRYFKDYFTDDISGYAVHLIKSKIDQFDFTRTSTKGIVVDLLSHIQHNLVFHDAEGSYLVLDRYVPFSRLWSILIIFADN